MAAALLNIERGPWVGGVITSIWRVTGACDWSGMIRLLCGLGLWRRVGILLISHKCPSLERYDFLAQRAVTAFFAIARRFAGDRAAARALPPLEAPSFDSATAAGLRVSGISAGLEACPVASWTICHAS